VKSLKLSKEDALVCTGSKWTVLIEGTVVKVVIVRANVSDSFLLFLVPAQLVCPGKRDVKQFLLLLLSAFVIILRQCRGWKHVVKENQTGYRLT